MKSFGPKYRIQASALGYAISFMMLIGMFASSVLFLTSTHKKIEANHLIGEHLLFDNLFSLHYGAKQVEFGDYEVIHPNGDTSSVVVKPWGFLKCVVTETYHGNRKIERVALTAQELENLPISLYFPSRKQELALAGDTRLEGKIYIPERGLERGHLTGKPYKNGQLHFGETFESEKYLPPLKESIRKPDLSYLLQSVSKLNALPEDSSFSFKHPTSIFTEVEPIYIHQKLTGNLVIRSFERITVAESANLKQLILIAPEIEFEEGFRGSVQVYATQRIHCGKGVFLEYPSALMLYEDQPISGIQSTISIEEDATVLGGILLISESPDFRNPLFLEVLDGTIGGFVYNQGETELRGELIGSLYTNKIIAHAGGGVYGNLLVDAKISAKRLPDEFIMPDWLKDSKTTKTVLISCF